MNGKETATATATITIDRPASQPTLYTRPGLALGLDVRSLNDQLSINPVSVQLAQTAAAAAIASAIEWMPRNYRQLYTPPARAIGAAAGSANRDHCPAITHTNTHIHNSSSLNKQQNICKWPG